MSYHTDTVLRSMPGFAFCQMDGGGMIVDRNTGEFVEADEIIRDPDHIWQFDCLDESHLGVLKGLFLDDESACVDDSDEPDEDDSDEDDSDGNSEDGNALVDLEAADYVATRELEALIAAQAADAQSTHFVTCTKGRHREFGNNKDDDGRIWKPRTIGRHGAQLHKDRRLRANGSGKTTARNAVW